MRPPLAILLLLGSLGLSVLLYALSGGRVIFFGLPLIFLAPVVWRGRRG